MFLQFFRALFSPAKAPVLLRPPNVESSEKPPVPATAMQGRQVKGLSCQIPVGWEVRSNLACGLVAYDGKDRRNLLGVSPCSEMKEDGQSLRDSKVGPRTMRMGGLPHQIRGTVYWVVNPDPGVCIDEHGRQCPIANLDYFWEERPGLILHLTAQCAVAALSTWEGVFAYAASTLNGQGFVPPVEMSGLTLELQDDRGVYFHFYDTDRDEPLRPQCFRFTRELFSEWLQACAEQSAFRLEQNGHALENRYDLGLKLATDDGYGPHFVVEVSAATMDSIRRLELSSEGAT